MNKLLVIAGPTASGKSAIALRVAEEFGGTIINADSMQVYQGVPILTAQPSAEDQSRVPHCLYGVMAPHQLCSAGAWREMAGQACANVWRQGGLPLLVGGTGLYIRSLIDGLSPIPDVPDAVRHETRHLFAALGNHAFHAHLAARDPVMAARLDPGNSQRLMRAWEVLAATGRSLAEWQAEPREGALAAQSQVLVLTPEREVLYGNCDRRFDRMIDQGAVAEVAALSALNLDPSMPVMKALGVAELGAYLRGECDLASAVARAQQATRNYAKRQLTWFRHQLIPQMQVNEQFSERLMEKIFSFIRQSLLTGAN